MGRRKRQRRRRKKDDLPVLLVGGVILYFAVASKYGAVLAGFLCVVALMIWVLFFMPTKCDYDLGDRGCILDAYGKLNGCYRHDREKRDAIFAALRLQNPGLLFRVRWSDGTRSGAGRVVGGSTRRDETAVNRARQGLYNGAMLAATVVAAVAGVLALFIPK